MKDVINELTKPLSSDDIELRIGTVKENAGFSLLAYKTARADVKRLNEVFGLQWSNSYYYDAQGLLCCSISVFDGEKWISRTDVGIESFTEKEKGSYSDAMKRAGFKWGIGIELYKYPFIWINWKNWNSRGNKAVPSCVYNIKNWKVANTEIGNITIVDENGEIIWQQNKKNNVIKHQSKNNNFDVAGFKKWLEDNDNSMPSTPKQHQLFNIELGKITDDNEKKMFYEWLQIKSSKELTSGKIDNLIKWLQKKNRSQDLKKIIGE